MLAKSMRPLLINAVLFQLCWFACVIGAFEVALIATAAFLIAHFVYVSRSQDDWLFGIRMAVVGWAMDAFLFYTGVFELSSGEKVLPLWLMCLWVVFGLSLTSSLSIMLKHFWLSVVVGGIGGAMAYFGGTALRDDIAFAEPLLNSVLLVGLCWAFYMGAASLFFQRERMQQFA